MPEQSREADETASPFRRAWQAILRLVFFVNGKSLVGEAVAAGADALSKAINLAALVHVLQQSLFEAAAGPGGLSILAIDFAAISNDPAQATARAARILGLEADCAAIDEAVAAAEGAPRENARQGLYGGPKAGCR